MGTIFDLTKLEQEFITNFPNLSKRPCLVVGVNSEGYAENPWHPLKEIMIHCLDKQKVRDAIEKAKKPYTDMNEHQINEIIDVFKLDFTGMFEIKKQFAKQILIYVRKMEEFERKRTCIDLLKELNLGDKLKESKEDC